MRQTDRFETHRECLVPHVKYRHRPTLIIDIENTFVTLLDIKTQEELETFKMLPNFATDYILIEIEES